MGLSTGLNYVIYYPAIKLAIFSYFSEWIWETMVCICLCVYFIYMYKAVSDLNEGKAGVIIFNIMTCYLYGIYKKQIKKICF